MNLKTGVSRKQSTPNFPKNEHFLPPDTHTYVCVSGGKKCSFFGKFGMLCFLKTPVLRFALSPYYRRILSLLSILISMHLIFCFQENLSLHHKNSYFHEKKRLSLKIIPLFVKCILRRMRFL